MTTTPQPTKPSVSKRLTSVLTVVAIWCAVGATAAYGIQKLTHHLTSPKNTPPNREGASIAETIKQAGLKISVPAGHGFWLTQDEQAETLVWRAAPSGPAREINLCQQVKNLPDELYPITLVGSWKNIEQGKRARNPNLARTPIAVSAELAQGMPQLTIRGRYHGELTAEVRPPEGNGKWALAFAEKQGNKFRLGKETWLLWGGAKNEENRGFTHAIRIRRQIQAPLEEPRHCTQSITEQLEWQLFIIDERLTPANGMAEVALRSKESAPPRHLRLPPGEHHTPRLEPMDMEDKALFNRAYAQGLIRQTPETQLAVVPADLSRAQAPVAGWEHVNLSDATVRQTFKALHRSPNGEFVQDRIAEFNHGQQWLAVRIRTGNANADLGQLSHWDAQASSQKLVLTHQMPDVTARLFDSIPNGWSSWIRVAGWPVSGSENAEVTLVTLNLTLPPSSPPGQPLEMLVLGRPTHIDGARLISILSACHTKACPTPQTLSKITLVPQASRISLTLLAEPDFNKLHPDTAASLRIQVKNGQAVWVSSQASGITQSTPANVTLSTRDGIPLFEDGKPLAAARELGVEAITGISAQHNGSIADMLGRLGQFGVVNADARLSLNSRWQQISHQILDCEGYRQGQWDHKTRQCQLPEHGINLPQQRIASLLLMDASNGDILAAAGAPGLPAGVSAHDALAFDRFNPAASPLRIHAWQHDNGRRFAPGSTFKLVAALGLESWAAGHPERQAELEGLNSEQWNQRGASLGFSMQSGAYPLNSRLAIANFEAKPATAAIRNGRLGLSEALEKSVNSWFAWMAQRTDQTAGTASDSVPLGLGALNEARPIVRAAQRLGFEQSQRLDAGLLPAQFRWQRDDVLATSPSRFDPIVDTHQIRSLAIGQRMSVTSLQMARITAAIATGKIPVPRVLLSLNGQPASEASPIPLPEEVTRIRKGMKAVVDTGTAASAFAGPAWHGVRPLIFGKTGSAEMGEPGNDNICPADRRGQAKKLKVAWFVGFFEAGVIPGYNRPLAFATAISHDCETGGAHAARVVASVIQALRQPIPAPQTGQQS